MDFSPPKSRLAGQKKQEEETEIHIIIATPAQNRTMI
jgi:hypothetical protein